MMDDRNVCLFRFFIEKEPAEETINYYRQIEMNTIGIVVNVGVAAVSAWNGENQVSDDRERKGARMRRSI